MSERERCRPSPCRNDHNQMPQLCMSPRGPTKADSTECDCDDRESDLAVKCLEVAEASDRHKHDTQKNKVRLPTSVPQASPIMDSPRHRAQTTPARAGAVARSRPPPPPHHPRRASAHAVGKRAVGAAAPHNKVSVVDLSPPVHQHSIRTHAAAAYRFIKGHLSHAPQPLSST